MPGNTGGTTPNESSTSIVTLDAFPVTQGANGGKIQCNRLRAMAQAHVERE